jgi:hypothetical protein
MWLYAIPAHLNTIVMGAVKKGAAIKGQKPIRFNN